VSTRCESDSFESKVEGKDGVNLCAPRQAGHPTGAIGQPQLIAGARVPTTRPARPVCAQHISSMAPPTRLSRSTSIPINRHAPSHRSFKGQTRTRTPRGRPASTSPRILSAHSHASNCPDSQPAYPSAMKTHPWGAFSPGAPHGGKAHPVRSLPGCWSDNLCECGPTCHRDDAERTPGR